MNGQLSTSTGKDYGPEKAQAAERRKQEAARVVLNPSDPAHSQVQTATGSKLFGQPIKVENRDSTSKNLSKVFGNWEDVKFNSQKSPNSNTGNGQSSLHSFQHFQKKPSHADQRRSSSHHSSRGSQPVHPLHQSGAPVGSSGSSLRTDGAPKTCPPSRPSSSQDGLGPSGLHRSVSPSRNHGRQSSMPIVTSGGLQANPSITPASLPSSSSYMASHINHLSSSANPMTSGSGSGSVVSPHHSSRPSGVKPTSTPTHQPRPTSEKAPSNPRVPSVMPNGTLLNKSNVTPVKKKDGLPKLKMPEAENAKNENIHEILKEMTQIQPPLTGIDTPHKAKVNFPFPSSQAADKVSSPPAANEPSKAVNDRSKDLEEDKRNQLIEDLSLSDDSDAEEQPPADNVEPETAVLERKEEPVSMEAVDSSRDDNMSSSSESSSEESDSTDSSGSDSSSENGEDDNEEEEEKEKPKPEVNIPPIDERPQQLSWGLKTFMVAHTPFNLPPMVPEKKNEDTTVAESASQKVAKASEETSKVSNNSSAGAGRKGRDARCSTSVPFSPQEPEEFLVKELGLGPRGNGVPTSEDARPADKAPASVASLQSPSTTSEGSTSSKKASGSKQKTPRSRSSPASAKAQETQHNRTPSTSSVKNSTNASSSSSSKKESSSSSKNGATDTKTSATGASVSTTEKKTSAGSKTKGSQGKTKPKSRLLISDDSDSDSEEESSSVVTTAKKASSSDKKSVVSDRDLIAKQLFSNDSSPIAKKQEEPVKSAPAPKEKTSHSSSSSKSRSSSKSSSSRSSKTTNHKKHDREPAVESGKPKASEKKSSSAKRARTSSTSSKTHSPKTKDMVSSVIESPPFKPPEPLSPLPQCGSVASQEQTSHSAVLCPGPLLNSKAEVEVELLRPPAPPCNSSTAFSPSAPHLKTVMPSPRQPSRDTQGHSSKTPSHRPATSSPAAVKTSIDSLVAQQPSPCGSHASSSSSSHKHKRSRSKSDHDSKGSSSAKQAKTSSSSRSSHKSPSSGHSHSSSGSTHHRGSSSNSSDKRKRPHSQSSSHSSHSSNGHSSSKRPCSPTRTGPSSSSPAVPPHASPSVTKKPTENQVPQQNGLPAATSRIKQVPRSNAQDMMYSDKNNQISAEEFLQRAKIIKHRADVQLLMMELPICQQTDPLSKLLTYTEALVVFIKSIHAMERNPETPIRDYYSGILNFIKHINKIRSYSELKGSPEPSPHSKKLAVLTLKTAALLCLKVYKSRKAESDKYRKVLDQKYSEMFQQSEKPQGRHCFPSPQANSWTPRPGNIPSPTSPAPSPAGSTASLGSQGSNDMPKINGTMPAAFVTMGNTMSLPTRIFQIQYQDYQVTSNLVHAHEYWEQANAIIHECKDFFKTLDRSCGGPLLLDSPIGHLVKYICEGVHQIRRMQSS